MRYWGLIFIKLRNNFIKIYCCYAFRIKSKGKKISAFCCVKNGEGGNFPGSPVVKIVLSMQRVQVQSLAEKLRSHMLCSQKLKQINKFKSKIFSKKWWRQIINYLHTVKKYWGACGEESDWTDMLCERASHRGPPFYSWNSLFYSETYSDFLVGLKKKK